MKGAQSGLCGIVESEGRVGEGSSSRRKRKRVQRKKRGGEGDLQALFCTEDEDSIAPLGGGERTREGKGVCVRGEERGLEERADLVWCWWWWGGSEE